MRKGIMALEGLEEPEVIEAEVTDFVEAPENDLADAAEAESELDEVNDGIDEAGETGETLEDIHEAMGESLEDGGMPEPEARALEVAVEHMCQRIGFSKRRKAFPAMEGFKEKGADRIKATKVAMEEIKGRISQIWDAIMGALAKAWEHIKTFFKSLVDGAVGLKKRAEALVAKAAHSGESANAGKKVNPSGFGKTLVVNGSVPVNEALVSAYETHIKDTFITADRSSLIAKVAPEIDKLAESKNPEEDFYAILKTLNGGFSGAAPTDKGNLEADEKATIIGHKLTFGGAEFVAIRNPTNFRVTIRTDEKEVTLPKEIEALSSSNVSKVAKLVSAHMATYSKSATAIGESINKISALVSKLKNGKSEDTKSIKYMGMLVRSLNAAVNQTTVLLKGYDVKVGKAVLDYAGASLSGKQVSDTSAAPANAPKLK